MASSPQRLAVRPQTTPQTTIDTFQEALSALAGRLSR